MVKLNDKKRKICPLYEEQKLGRTESCTLPVHVFVNKMCTYANGSRCTNVELNFHMGGS
jgi:hypothetical protein